MMVDHVSRRGIMPLYCCIKSKQRVDVNIIRDYGYGGGYGGRGGRDRDDRGFGRDRDYGRERCVTISCQIIRAFVDLAMCDMACARTSLVAVRSYAIVMV